MSDAQSDGIERSEFPYWSHKFDEARVEYLEDPTDLKRNTVLEYALKMDQHSTLPHPEFHANSIEQLRKLDEGDELAWLHVLWNAGSLWYSRLLAVSPYKGKLTFHIQIKPGTIDVWGPGLDQLVLSLLNQKGVTQTELWESHMIIMPPVSLEDNQFSIVKVAGHS